MVFESLSLLLETVCVTCSEMRIKVDAEDFIDQIIICNGAYSIIYLIYFDYEDDQSRVVYIRGYNSLSSNFKDPGMEV